MGGGMIPYSIDEVEQYIEIKIEQLKYESWTPPEEAPAVSKARACKKEDFENEPMKQKLWNGTVSKAQGLYLCFDKDEMTLKGNFDSFDLKGYMSGIMLSVARC